MGDACLSTVGENFHLGHPQLARVALQQGKNLADNFIATLQGKPLKQFVYDDKGSMAIIGRHKAVANLPKPKMCLTGWIAMADMGIRTPFFLDQLPQQDKDYAQLGSSLFYKGSVIENDNKTCCSPGEKGTVRPTCRSVSTS
jgi:hypothetical protein